jgi:hypothetical protein
LFSLPFHLRLPIFFIQFLVLLLSMCMHGDCSRLDQSFRQRCLLELLLGPSC